MRFMGLVMNSFYGILLAGVLASNTALYGGDEIRIGELTSITGPSASFGVCARNGTALAIEQINAKGGVLGKRLKLIVQDDRSVAGEAATVARKLLYSDKVVAILGEVSSSKSLEAAPICQEAKTPMISPAATNPKVTETGDYIFRVCFIDAFQGEVMGRFALSRQFKRIAVLTDERQDYSKGLAAAFVAYLSKHGGEVVKAQSYCTGDKDFRAQLTSIKSAKPDAVFLPGYYTEVALIARQGRQLGIKTPFLGGDGWVGEPLLKVAGNALDGCFYSSHFSEKSPEPSIVAFLAAYRAKFGSKPDDMAALGYDSAVLLADAIKRAGATAGAALRDAIASTKNFPGITGSITIDNRRNARKPAVIQAVEGGKSTFLETVLPY